MERGSALSAPVFAACESGVPSPSYEHLKSGGRGRSLSPLSAPVRPPAGPRGGPVPVSDSRGLGLAPSVLFAVCLIFITMRSYGYSDTCLVNLENPH